MRHERLTGLALSRPFAYDSARSSRSIPCSRKTPAAAVIPERTSQMFFPRSTSFRSALQNPLQELDLTSFALDGDPMLIETEHLNFKVFHDDEDKLGLYFEMFLHIPSGYVRFDEKDEEYRENVLRSFAALQPIPA